MSEFGRGVVVPLVKFSEHLGDHWARDIERAIHWVKADPTERERILTANEEHWQTVLRLDAAAESPEHMLSGLIMMWAQGASDHLSEIEEDKAPKSLTELASLMFKLRYTRFHDLVGEEEWVKLLALWSAAAMDIDEMLGAQPDWGDW